MAFKKVTHDSLFEDNITKHILDEFDTLIKKGVDVKEALTKIKKELQEINEIKNAEQFKLFTEQSSKLEKAQKELIKTEQALVKVQDKLLAATVKRKKANKDLTKTQKDKLKLDQQIKEANSDAIQDNEELKVQLQQQRKVNKELAKDKLGLISVYDKESRILNDLRKEYKDLAVQNKENTKEGKALLKNIVERDKKLKAIDETVGQNQRSVGDYSKALKGLNSTMGKLGVVAVLAKGMQLLGSAFGDTREGALALEIGFSKFTETAKVFIGSVVNAFGGLVDYYTAIFDSIKMIGVQIELTFLKIDRSISVLPETIEKLDKEIEILNGEMDELSKSSITDALLKIKKAFEGNIESTGNAIDAQAEYLELQLRTRIAIEQQQKALAGLAEKRQILQDISDDDTIGFVTRAEAVKKAQEAAIEFARLEETLALTKEKLTIQAVKQDLRRAKVLSESQLLQIQTGEQLQEILLDVNLARKVSDVNDEAFTAAFVERRDKEVEAQAFARDQEEKNRKTARDAFEQELDILEEFTEKRVAFNEKIISSDKSSIEDRLKALQENQRIEKELFDSSIKLILEQGKASIDLRKDLTDLEKEHQKSLLTSAAIQEIVNEQDAQEIFNLIRKLDLGEIEEKRLKETLKINQDINEVNKESSTALQESIEQEKLAADELLNEINRTRREGIIAATEDREESRKLREEDLRLQAKFETDLLEENSDERKLIAEKLKNDLAEIERERVADVEAANKKIEEDDKKLRQKRIDNAVDFANQVADILIDQLSKRNDAVNEAFNEEINSLQESIDRQIEANKAGGEENLANDQALLAKRKLERQRELEDQAIRERNIALAQQFINSVASHSKDDPEGAIIKALAETFAANGIAQLIAGFEKGGLVEGNEQIIKINEKGQEFVIDAPTTKAMGLDKKGSSMKTFHERFIDNINIPQHLYQNIDSGGTLAHAADYSQIIKSQAKNADKITETIRKNSAHSEVLLDSLGRVVTKMTKGGLTEKIVYESDADWL